MNRFEFYDKLNKYKANSIDKKDDNSLSHYGTIGQKWGTRRWQNYDGTFNAAGKERYFGKNGTTKKNGDDDKLGAGPIATLAFTVKSVIDGVHNYDDVQDLREKYDKFMTESDAGFTKEERMSVMNNKKRIAKMQEALEKGDEEKYNKLLKKVKGEDKEAVEKFLNDLNKKNNETSKVSEENQKVLDEQLGSISKPKIRKSYLNEDGTLNEKGKTRTASNRKISDIASSVFMALRNINWFNAATMPVTGLVLSLTGFGIPAALAVTLAGAAASSAAAGVDHALYKKLEKRADAYYEMLQ